VEIRKIVASYLFACNPWAQWLRDCGTKVMDGVPRSSERAHGVKITAENIVLVTHFVWQSEYIIAVQSRIDLRYLYNHTCSWCSISHLSVGTIETGESFQSNILHRLEHQSRIVTNSLLIKVGLLLPVKRSYRLSENLAYKSFCTSDPGEYFKRKLLQKWIID
jgi:hypothetical protein